MCEHIYCLVEPRKLPIAAIPQEKATLSGSNMKGEPNEHTQVHQRLGQRSSLVIWNPAWLKMSKDMVRLPIQNVPCMLPSQFREYPSKNNH